MEFYHVHFKRNTFTFDNISDARKAKEVFPLIGAGAYVGCDCHKSVNNDRHYSTYTVKVEL